MVLRDNEIIFILACRKLKKLEFLSMGLLIFAFNLELWQILFSHTLLWGNLNNAVLTN